MEAIGNFGHAEWLRKKSAKAAEGTKEHQRRILSVVYKNVAEKDKNVH